MRENKSERMTERGNNKKADAVAHGNELPNVREREPPAPKRKFWMQSKRVVCNPAQI